MFQALLKATDSLPSWNFYSLRRKTINKWIYNMMPGCHKCYEEKLKEILVIKAREPSRPYELCEKHNKSTTFGVKHDWKVQWQSTDRASSPSSITISVYWVRFISQLNVWIESDNMYDSFYLEKFSRILRL